MRFLSKVIGYLVSALGLGVVTFGLLALADPSGSQLAKDSDPFGIPRSSAQLLIQIAVGAVGLLLGIWLVVRKHRG